MLERKQTDTRKDAQNIPILDVNQDVNRRSFLGYGLGIIALGSLSVQGCSKSKPPPSLGEIAASLSNSDTQRAAALHQLGITVPTKASPLLDKLLTLYGSALAVESLEQGNRQTDNLFAKILISEAVVDTRILQAAISRDCAAKLREICTTIYDLQLSALDLIREKNRDLSALERHANNLALKLDQHPVFNWKPSTTAIGAFIHGAPSGRDFQKLKELTAAAIRSVARD